MAASSIENGTKNAAISIEIRSKSSCSGGSLLWLYVVRLEEEVAQDILVVVDDRRHGEELCRRSPDPDPDPDPS